MNDELDAKEAAALRAAFRARADHAPVRPPGTVEVRRLSALRRRRQAAVALGVASLAVLGGLVVANHRRDPVPTASEGKGPGRPTTTVATTLPAAVPPPDAIPLPTIGAYPRDPAMGPQPQKVTYVVKEGDTIESIAAVLGTDAETVRAQTGGTVVVGQTLSLLVGVKPSVVTTVPVVLNGG